MLSTFSENGHFRFKLTMLKVFTYIYEVLIVAPRPKENTIRVVYQNLFELCLVDRK